MLTIHLDPQSSLSLYDQIYLHIRQDIRSGILSEQTRLPSARSLAAHLSVSRNTVDMAYSQLLSEGYIESRPKSGFYVCDLSVYETTHRTHTPAVSGNSETTTSAHSVTSSIKIADSNSLSPDTPTTYDYDFSPFFINTASFPYRIWQRLTGQILREHGNELFLLGDRQGEPELRAAIAAYLYEARGFHCDPDHIIIGAGADYLLQLLVQLLDFPDEIAMENPCYLQAARIFRGFGCQVLPIPLDANGLSYEKLRQTSAHIAYLTPSHQYPLGLVMPVGRRRELLHWAAETGSYLIEDDHDSEFRYKGRPIPALKEMDTADSVIYVGTFSRAIAPAIRAGYMVLPDALLQTYRQNFRHYASTVSRIDQMILTRFLTEGYFERHLNKCRKIYKSRHDTLLQEFRSWGDRITILGENAGLHVAVQFHDGRTEESIIRDAKKTGIRLHGLSAHYLDPAPKYPPTILFGFGGMEEKAIEEGINKLRG